MAHLEVQIRLGGHPATTGSLEAVARPPAQRAGRAVGTLLLLAAIGAVVFFIPPHFPWVIGALGVGTFFAFREWRSEYRVERFSGSCPRCDAALVLPPGEGIRFPLELTCFNCHHEPVVTLST